jgi:hypothetical protein
VLGLGVAFGFGLGQLDEGSGQAAQVGLFLADASNQDATLTMMECSAHSRYLPSSGCYGFERRQPGIRDL